jgi:PRTRC genetic system protein E
MFAELAPILEKRAIVIIAARNETNGKITLSVAPQANKKDDPDLDKALLIPYTAEGTGEELDHDLIATLQGYTAKHVSAGESLQQVHTDMDAALEEAKAVARAKVDAAKAKNKTTVPAKPTSVAKPAAPAPKLEPPRPPSLFDLPMELAATALEPAVAVPAPGESVPAPATEHIQSAPEEATPEIGEEPESELQDDEDDLDPEKGNDSDSVPFDE